MAHILNPGTWEAVANTSVLFCINLRPVQSTSLVPGQGKILSQKEQQQRG